MRRFRLVIAAIVAMALHDGAAAQGVIQQSGPVTPFHSSVWLQNGLQADAGTPATPNLSALGLFNGAACPFGISSQTGPALSTSPYAQLTICQTATTTTLVFAGVNGEPDPAVYFNIGGVLYPFPGGFGNVSGPPSSVIGDVACWAATTGSLLEDCTVAAVAGGRLAFSAVSGLPTCNSAAEGTRREVTDAADPSYLAPVYGGGSVDLTVGCNGSAWVAGY